jgi:hypothetical protein
MYRFFFTEDMYRFSREEFYWEMHLLAVGGAASPSHSLYNGGQHDTLYITVVLQILEK